MFFKRKNHRKEKALCDFVEKTNDTGYIFVNINNDLGNAVENGADDWPPLMLMAYGYARRAAVAALYIQGIVEKDQYDHVKAIFKGMQVKTGHTVEFQEEAFAESVKFMTEYSQAITSFSVKKIIQIAEEYEIPSGTLSDAELFENVIDTAHLEQNSHGYNSDVKSNGESDIVKNISQGVNSRIGSKNIALQFVLEELDAARQGNEEAIQFVKNSGFSPSEYEGAMQNSFEEVDGPNGPQQFLLSSVMQYSSDMDFMVNLRLQVVENIINYWELNTQREGRIDKLFQSLRNILEDDESVMPALTSNIPAPATAKAKHIHFRQKNIDSAKSIVSTLSEITGDDIDTIIKNSLQNSTPEESAKTNGGMRLEEAEVDILFIVRNNNVIFINDEADHLFTTDKDGDEKLDGRVVNFVFSGQSDGEVIEMFVAFDDSDSYTMFTLQAGVIERLNYVAQAIFKYFAEAGIQNVFSPVERYSSQYIYTFKLYRKNGKCFLVNNAQTQAYLIEKSGIMRDDVDEIKNIFWNEYSTDQEFDDDIPF